MRGIKFRVWDVESPYMYSWEEIQQEWENEGYFDSVFRYDHWIPMQFTGLKDKNGKEIYESDLLTGKTMLGNTSIKKIIWCDEKGGFILESIDTGIQCTVLDIKYGEVIGNIYENPELKEQ